MPADKTSRSDGPAVHLDREKIELPDVDLPAFATPSLEPPTDRAPALAPRNGPGVRGGRGGGVGRGRPAAPGRRYAFRRS
ncbi:hypothetical protein [Plantactinospora sp. GCM10030261]|uniref:hypothetical protein n=1 Tax=Plantactinospora sp. GCM10030261 TaxID=3273420 RepID=UPI003607B540